MSYQSIVWEWADRRGLEHLQLFISEHAVKAEGVVVADTKDGTINFRHVIAMTAEWVAHRCLVFIPTRPTNNSLKLLHSDGRWRFNDVERPDLDGCSAVDLLDTPFPKTAVVKNLRLEPGESKGIKVALVDNRRLSVAAVEQEWERLPDREGDQCYRCATGSAMAEFSFDQDFIVSLCLQRWRRKAGPRCFEAGQTIS